MKWLWRRNGPPALVCLQLRGHLEFRVKLNVWDVMMPVKYGYATYPQRQERHADLFDAISALVRFNKSWS